MTRRARWAVVIGLVALTVGGAVIAAAAVSERDRECWPTLVPAYVSPGELVDLARGPRPPALMIVNPASGPGTQPDPAYRDAVRVAQDAGSRVIGYVSTAYGARPSADIMAEAERYLTWYGVDGIFLDEASHRADDLPHYRAVSDALRRAGEGLLVINPGVVPARGYFALADVVVTFEGPYADYRPALRRAPAWLSEQPRGTIAHLVYAATPTDLAAIEALHPSAGYVYVTAGRMPDPWGSTPGYPAPENGDAPPCG